MRSLSRLDEITRRFLSRPCLTLPNTTTSNTPCVLDQAVKDTRLPQVATHPRVHPSKILGGFTLQALEEQVRLGIS